MAEVSKAASFFLWDVYKIEVARVCRETVLSVWWAGFFWAVSLLLAGMEGLPASTISRVCAVFSGLLVAACWGVGVPGGVDLGRLHEQIGRGFDVSDVIVDETRQLVEGLERQVYRSKIVKSWCSASILASCVSAGFSLS